MEFRELQELIRIFEESGLSEIEIEEDGQRMRLIKPTAHGASQITVPVVSDEPAAAPPAEDEPVEEVYELTIDSPMVGTFYSAPAPGEPPFIQVGDQVDDGQTVCIVEAMKLMNEVGSKFPCVIEKILVENGQPVEFGQSLFAIRKP